MLSPLKWSAERKLAVLAFWFAFDAALFGRASYCINSSIVDGDCLRIAGIFAGAFVLSWLFKLLTGMFMEARFRNEQRTIARVISEHRHPTLIV